MSPTHKQKGRLLNEFLVSLGLLFLAMIGDFAVIHSSVRIAERTSVSARALSLARSGVESVISNPGKYQKGVVSESFGAGKGATFDEIFSRRCSLIPIKSGELTLHKVVVTVEWADGTERVNLERYVRTDR